MDDITAGRIVGTLNMILERYTKSGPTLRDRFAMAALGGMLAGPRDDPSGEEIEALARVAYESADAMLKVRADRRTAAAPQTSSRSSTFGRGGRKMRHRTAGTTLIWLSTIWNGDDGVAVVLRTGDLEPVHVPLMELDATHEHDDDGSHGAAFGIYAQHARRCRRCHADAASRLCDEGNGLWNTYVERFNNERTKKTKTGAAMNIPTSATELFDEQLPLLLKEHPDKAREIGAVYAFEIASAGPENGGTWVVDLTANPPFVKKGTEHAGAAQCTFKIAGDDFIQMLSNPALGMQFYFQGKLRVTGDPMLATKLQKLFALGRP